MPQIYPMNWILFNLLMLLIFVLLKMNFSMGNFKFKNNLKSSIKKLNMKW